MNATFLVQETMTIEARRLFVLAGQVLEGRVKPGMQITMRLNNDQIIEAPIHSLERVQGPADAASTGLGIEYEDADELLILQSLKLVGQVLPVEDETE